MPTATMTSKGQITVPQAVRTALCLYAGSKVEFVPVADGFMIVPLPSAHMLKGRFAGRVVQPVSIERMVEAVGAEATLCKGRRKR